MRFRKLRIAWSALGGVACLLLIVLWVHTIRNQVKAAAWVSKSHYISFVAFKLWLQADVWRPSWEPRGYLHSLHVANPDPLTSPVHRWYVGPQKQTGSLGGTTLRIPLWVPVLSSVFFGTLPWLVAISKLRQFSLRTLLIATTLVASVLGAIVYATR